MSAVPPGVRMPFPDHRFINAVCPKCGCTMGKPSQERGICSRCDGSNFPRSSAYEPPAKADPFDGVDYS